MGSYFGNLTQSNPIGISIAACPTYQHVATEVANNNVLHADLGLKLPFLSLVLRLVVIHCNWFGMIGGCGAWLHDWCNIDTLHNIYPIPHQNVFKFEENLRKI
eukprot:4674193-Ditylum_brightwellii.AAC.1